MLIILKFFGNDPEQRLSISINEAVPHVRIETVVKYKTCLGYVSWEEFDMSRDHELPSHLSGSCGESQNNFECTDEPTIFRRICFSDVSCFSF